MAGRQWAVSFGVLAAVASLVLSGCAREIGGAATSIYDDPFRVAGLDATSGPSGARTGVPDAPLFIEGGDGGVIDVAAANAISDIEEYWSRWYPELFGSPFEPVSGLLSWDPFDTGGVAFCGGSTERLVNAGYCVDDDTIGWDRAVLMPQVAERFGVVAMVFVLAHEYGHAIQTAAGTVGREPADLIVREQQADCYAGAFMRHVAEGNAPHFRLNTSDGLNNVLASAVAIGDTDPHNPANVHGSAFERVTATQIGFTDGPAPCARMDAKEVASRRADLPQRFTDAADDGELPITEASVRAFVDSVGQVLALDEAPTLSLGGADLGCPDARATDPVSYCPSTNTIGVDVAELARRGTPEEPTRQELFSANLTGDYNGYVLLVSRYTLALQQARGDDLRSPRTALRAACLSGVVTRALSPDHPERLAAGSVWLSPGDLDEAVSGLLSDGLAASDVDGRTVPSGFSRVDAFRTGVLGGEAVCEGRYSG
ncbi:metallopeptidase [Rhodococcus triatomae]|uniref:Predicted metalloprotease n=1 Tax=Rhodococcus triatomae TaxID=300028 RepID=A0A1G8E3N1_9NOCA|nr:neutral zinc metallopeptidase [Rhodococcus triatomae]QNG18286.1 metallopeptidase [Rhodococcus triatomae]QNG22043.1 metallopeptidase [Rhodococcus triatomae]SDH64546.1 Predicted metalloprotease [Rhodococcus triatomae]